jgi:hypothetical protein
MLATATLFRIITPCVRLDLLNEIFLRNLLRCAWPNLSILTWMR